MTDYAIITLFAGIGFTAFLFVGIPIIGMLRYDPYSNANLKSPDYERPLNGSDSQ